MKSGIKKAMKDLLWLFLFPYYIYRYVFIALAMLITGEKEKNKKTKTIGHVLVILFFVLLVPIFISFDYYLGNWRQLEDQFHHADLVEYQYGEHQISMVRGTSLESYTVKLLISDKGLNFSPIHKSKNQTTIFESPLYIPWNKVEKCMKGGDYGNNVTRIHLSIKDTDIIVSLNHWDLMSPLCVQKRIPISNY